MKYIFIIIVALIFALFESTIGGLAPFVFIPYILFISIFVFWAFDRLDGFLFLAIGGLGIDLLNHHWIGTTYLAFLSGLLVLFAINSIVDLTSDDRRSIGSIIHLVLTIIFNYFLIILQDNKLAVISYSYLIQTSLISFITFLLIWIALSSKFVKKKKLYA
jgi:hypothetical protein